MKGQGGRHLKAIAGGFLYQGWTHRYQPPHAGGEEGGDFVEALVGGQT
jgi:hypothetical protein